MSADLALGSSCGSRGLNNTKDFEKCSHKEKPFQRRLIMLLLIIINCMDSIYLIHRIYNNDTINDRLMYYNLHAINTHSILLIITNNKKIIEYNNISQVKENILLLKHQEFFYSP